MELAVHVERQEEVSSCTLVPWTWDDDVFLTRLGLESDRDLMQHLGSGLEEWLRVLLDSVFAFWKLEDAEHGTHESILEGVLGVATIIALWSSIRLSQRDKQFAVLVRCEQVLWVLGESLVGRWSPLKWKTTRAGRRPG